uniref:Uncharacterized protein n=1 Tax=Phytophthora ramorum TaxID=164328 RepID=H3GHP6_PHYRM
MILRAMVMFVAVAAIRGESTQVPAKAFAFSKVVDSAPTPTPLVTVAASDTLATIGTPEATVSSFGLSRSDDDSFDSLDSEDSDSTDSEDSDSIDSIAHTALSSKSDRSDRDSTQDEATDRVSDAAAESELISRTMNAALTMGGVIKATSTIKSTYTNWVGSALDTSIANACYREAHIAKTCPLGFEGKLGTCWAQCPYAYPVECGMECIRQNDDCALEIVTKVTALAQTTLSLISYDVFGKFAVLARAVQVAIKCAKYTMGLIKSLAKYVRALQVSDPQTSQDKILTMLYQTDNVVIDIPIAVAYCIGNSVSDDVKFVDSVMMTAEYVLKEVIANGATIISSWGKFTSFMKNITLGETLSSLSKSDITSLESAMESNSTCGYDMKRLLDRTWMTVAEYRKQNPEMSEDDIRVAMSKSNLVLNDIPIATNNCMGELIEESDEKTAYATRDTLRKTFASVVDDLISSGTSSNGSFLHAGEYAFKIADKALGMYAIWDDWSVAGSFSEYFQPICGPTQLIGEVDDGSAEKALALKMVQGAFNNSDGTWTKVGDGSVNINFKSEDTKDVTVNIISGGNKIDEVDVRAGETATWVSNVTALGGKTLYLDRWRPGFLGLPGTGGGSLLLWVPQSSQGGSLQLDAILNVS